MRPVVDRLLLRRPLVALSLTAARRHRCSEFVSWVDPECAAAGDRFGGTRLSVERPLSRSKVCSLRQPTRAFNCRFRRNRGIREIVIPVASSAPAAGPVRRPSGHHQVPIGPPPDAAVGGPTTELSCAPEWKQSCGPSTGGFAEAWTVFEAALLTRHDPRGDPDPTEAGGGLPFQGGDSGAALLMDMLRQRWSSWVRGIAAPSAQYRLLVTCGRGRSFRPAQWFTLAPPGALVNCAPPGEGMPLSFASPGASIPLNLLWQHLDHQQRYYSASATTRLLQRATGT